MMTAAGKIRQLGIITALAMAINIMLNLALIPTMSGQGAAAAALVTQIFVAILCMVTVHHTMAKVINRKRAISFLALFLITLSAGLFFNALSVPWYLSASLQLALGTSVALILRLIEPMKSIKLLLQK